jgi:hypothetical protein
VIQRGEDQWDLVLRLVTTAPPTEADQEKSRLVRGSLRIHPHQKTGTVRILERWQSGDGKLLASVSLGRSRAPVCIILLTRVSRVQIESRDRIGG